MAKLPMGQMAPTGGDTMGHFENQWANGPKSLVMVLGRGVSGRLLDTLSLKWTPWFCQKLDINITI